MDNYRICNNCKYYLPCGGFCEIDYDVHESNEQDCRNFELELKYFKTAQEGIENINK